VVTTLPAFCMHVPMSNDRVQATYLSASDVVAALTALLEQPLSVRDDATPRDRFWCVCTSVYSRHGHQRHSRPKDIRCSIVAQDTAFDLRAVRCDARACSILRRDVVCPPTPLAPPPAGGHGRPWGRRTAAGCVPGWTWPRSCSGPLCSASLPPRTHGALQQDASQPWRAASMHLTPGCMQHGDS
jgi:hypothetical protein